jgi:hypothetical protein
VSDVVLFRDTCLVGPTRAATAHARRAWAGGAVRAAAAVARPADRRCGLADGRPAAVPGGERPSWRRARDGRRTRRDWRMYVAYTFKHGDRPLEG